MQPVSARWDGAVRGFSQIVTSAEVWRGGVRQETLTLAGGTVRGDEAQAVRRSLTCSLADLYVGGVGLTPREAGDLLAPTGCELRLYSGYVYPDGSRELVPIGVFPVSRTARSSWLSGVEITAPDRARRVARARFLAPRSIAAGTLVTAAIRSLLIEVDASWEVYDLTGSLSKTTTITYDRLEDRLDKVRQLAASIGAEVHVDAAGRWLIRPVPSGGAPVWTLDTTGAASVLDVGQAMDSERVYNAVIAYSSEVGAEPVAGYAYIASGPLSVAEYGPVPYGFASPVGIKTRNQAVSAALAMLPRVSRVNRVVTPRIAPNRALDLGDPLTLSLPDEDPRVVNLAAFSFALGPDAQGMPVELRDDSAVATAYDIQGVAL